MVEYRNGIGSETLSEQVKIINWKEASSSEDKDRQHKEIWQKGKFVIDENFKIYIGNVSHNEIIARNGINVLNNLRGYIDKGRVTLFQAGGDAMALSKLLEVNFSDLEAGQFLERLSDKVNNFLQK